MGLLSILRISAMSLVIGGLTAQADPITMEPGELNVLAGDDWVGELTYRGYEPPFDEEVIPLVPFFF